MGLAGLLLAGGLTAARHPAQNDGPWKTWDDAYSLARQHDRTVFYFVYSIKCSNCKKIFTEHFAREDVSALIMQYYVPVLSEVDNEKDSLVTYKGARITQDSLQRRLLELAKFPEPGYKLPLMLCVQPNDTGDDRVDYAHGYIELNDLMAFINKNRRGQH